MAVIFAVVGGAAVVGIANYDDYSNHSDHSDYSVYSDYAERRRRKINELDKSIDSERNAALKYIEQTVKPYLEGTHYTNYESKTIFDVDYNNLDTGVRNKINSDCTRLINSEKASIEKEIKDIDAMLDLLNKIELKTKEK